MSQGKPARELSEPAAAKMEPLPLDSVTPQFTLRAVLTGMILGGMLSICNIYTGLTIGWGLNMSIASAVIAYGFWQAVHITFKTRPWNLLENNINQTAASSAAAVSSAGLVAGVPALTYMTGAQLSWLHLSIWTFSVCLVGISVAIGMRRQLIIRDKLAFPSGIASAATLREMHSHGAEAMRKVLALLAAAVVACALMILKYAGVLSSWMHSAWTVGGFSLKSLTFVLNPNLLMYGVGAIIGIRTTSWLILGSLFAWLVVAPPLIQKNYIRLAVSEPLFSLPAGVVLPHEPHGFAKYNAERKRLEWKGRMSAGERDALLAQSEEPLFREVVQKLYVRSQYDLKAPLPADFEYVTTTLVRFEQVSAEIPRGFFVPHAHDAIVQLDRKKSRVVVNGRVSEHVLAACVAHADAHARAHPADAARMEAFKTALQAAAAQSNQPLGGAGDAAEQLTPRVRYDPARQALTARGVLAADDVKAVEAALPASRELVESAAALRTASQFRPAQANFADVVAWLLWPGVAMMVVSSLVSFAFSWKSIVRAIVPSRTDAQSVDVPDVPDKYLVSTRTWGTLIAGATLLSVMLQVAYFGISWWTALLGVLMSFVLALVAGRVAGETNTVPVGAMGKVTQLAFGVVAPADPAANLMAATVTGGAASQCSDLLFDLKTGQLVGATPRYQSYAQLCGALAGSFMGTGAYFLLLPDPKSQLFTDQFNAPAVATWKAVAELFQVGFQAIPQGAPLAILIASIVGVILPLLERFLPRAAAMFVPSPAAIGLAFVITGDVALSMFVGAVVALIVGKLFPNWASRFIVTLAAGLVAGESLTGAGISIYELTKM